MPRVTEPDENLVHYVGDSLTGSVTLCGLTDFLRSKERGETTDAPVTCNACISIREHCAKYAPHK